MKKVPLKLSTTMKNRESLSRWVYNLHEEINRMLGKKSNLSYDEVRDRYEIFRARCIDDSAGSKKKTQKKKMQPVKEKGCTNPLYGVRSKCVINIVPKTRKCKSFTIDKKCRLRRKIKK